MSPNDSGWSFTPRYFGLAIDPLEFLEEISKLQRIPSNLSSWCGSSICGALFSPWWWGKRSVPTSVHGGIFSALHLMERDRAHKWIWVTWLFWFMLYNVFFLCVEIIPRELSCFNIYLIEAFDDNEIPAYVHLLVLFPQGRNPWWSTWVHRKGCYWAFSSWGGRISTV